MRKALKYLPVLQRRAAPQRRKEKRRRASSRLRRFSLSG
jgi:hypothetical protein